MGILEPRRRPDFDAADWVDRALRGGLSFGVDSDGEVWRWEALPEEDPGPSETYSRLCQELDRFRPLVRDEIKRRAHAEGTAMSFPDMIDPDRKYQCVMLTGTPCLRGN